MGSYEYDNNSDNDWEDSWETIWNEFNWEQYLRSEGDEIGKYRKLYGKLIKSENRLDEVALFMGWQQPGSEQAEESPESTDLPLPPYTIHRHPLFISSKALHSWLIDNWGKHVALCCEKITAQSALRYQSAVNESDYYGLLAVTALDMNDFSLAIAYFKRGMVAINKALALLAEFESLDLEPLPLYIKHARVRLFDIREIWLRVSSDCRATISRGSDDE